jgi:hypothetical protein
VLFAGGCLLGLFLALVVVLGLAALRDAVVLAGVLAVHATLLLAYLADRREWLGQRLEDDFLDRWDALLAWAVAQRARGWAVGRAREVRERAARVSRVQQATGMTSQGELRALVAAARAAHAALQRPPGAG